MIPWLQVAPDWVYDWVQYWASKFNDSDRRAILRFWAKWLPVKKVQMISTKYFRGIDQGHYVLYLQNMNFMRLIFWPGGAYTDYAQATTFAITIPYYDSFHESRLYRLIMAMPNEPKSTKKHFSTTKNTTMKKKTKKTTCFWETLAGRTVVHVLELPSDGGVGMVAGRLAESVAMSFFAFTGVVLTSLISGSDFVDDSSFSSSFFAS